jgi:UDP-N-acetyl-D-glucosamine dehydrogenase
MAGAADAGAGAPGGAPSRPIARQLLALGAEVRVADPHTDDDQTPAGTTRVDATSEEAAAADLVVLLVDHDAFALDDLAASSAHVLDCRRRVTGAHVESL